MLPIRCFATGAAVSSFLLRPDTGVAQGFRFYDADLPEATGADAAPTRARSASESPDAAETGVRMQGGRRFFLFVQVDQRDADAAVARLAALLKSRQMYDGATIVLIGDHGEEPTGTLDDAVLRVPLIVKQPEREGAGRHVSTPVQQVDVVPTLLDLVRAPVPSALSGRSLRAVLTDKEATLSDRPLYAEWLPPRYGGFARPGFSFSTAPHRHVSGGGA